MTINRAETRRNSQPTRVTADQRREAVIAGVLAGQRVSDIAAGLGVRAETVSRLLHEPETAARLSQLRQEVTHACRDALMALQVEALAVVAASLRSGSDPHLALGVLRLTLPFTSRSESSPLGVSQAVIDQMTPEQRRERLAALVSDAERRLGIDRANEANLARQRAIERILRFRENRTQSADLHRRLDTLAEG